MDETNMVVALNTVIGDASIQSAFNSGLTLGATIVGVLFAISLLRLITDDGHEEL